MDESLYLAAFIAVSAVATFLTRATPFLFLSRHSNHPFILHLGRYLPAAVMCLLVVIFLLRSAQWQAPLFGADAVLPSALVILLQLWRHNALLSIVAGTLTYMGIQQI
ncbi:MAG: AzlD domain-containing protein [Oleiphilaceae bacterium]|nr:AzlD domain-containing protein [Oleiphilaceae bacterium]